jgi:acetate kinase
MNILTLNAGSSSLKYKLFAMDAAETILTEGNVDHSGGDTTADAAADAIKQCLPHGIDALGYRVVHGGPRYTTATRITPDVLAGIRALSDLAPLHNPIDAAVIEAGQRALPDTPGVAVFDTAFHHTLPNVASQYAIPHDLAERLHLKRYGAHGISYQYVSGRLLEALGRDAAGTRLIICHLGSGASVCALRDGKSADTSMGLTPLEGLVMGTRSGDIDPGLLLYLQRSQHMTPDQLDDMLNHQSGLLGLSGRSADVRDLEAAAKTGDVLAGLALAVFAYRVRKYIGAYAAALGGMDALAFTGGIGQHSAAVRGRACTGLDFLGLTLDPDRNDAVTGHDPASIGAASARIPVWVIPTDEERQIARETATLLRS